MTENIQNSSNSEKIPIVYFIDKFMRAGGTERQLGVLIDNLNRDQFEPYIFNLRPKESDLQTDIDCDVEFLGVTRLMSFKAFKTVFKVSRMLKERNVKILQMYFIESRLIGTLAGKLARIPVLIFCRREMGWWHTPLKLIILKFLARLSDYCLVNADCVKEMAAKAESFPRDKIEVIYNGIDINLRNSGTPVSKSSFNIPEDAPLIGHIANYRPVKRIDRLLDAISRLKNRDAHVLLLGTGELKNELEKQTEELGIRDRVHFYHTINGIKRIVELFNIGVLASESEGLSNVLIEYAICGIPAIGFDIGGNAEVIVNGETGFIVSDNNTDSLAAKIDLLLQDSELAEKLGKQAKDRAIKLFNMDNMVKKTENTYIRLLPKA